MAPQKRKFEDDDDEYKPSKRPQRQCTGRARATDEHRDEQPEAGPSRKTRQRSGRATETNAKAGPSKKANAQPKRGPAFYRRDCIPCNTTYDVRWEKKHFLTNKHRGTTVGDFMCGGCGHRYTRDDAVRRHVFNRENYPSRCPSVISYREDPTRQHLLVSIKVTSGQPAPAPQPARHDTEASHIPDSDPAQRQVEGIESTQAVSAPEDRPNHASASRQQGEVGVASFEATRESSDAINEPRSKGQREETPEADSVHTPSDVSAILGSPMYEGGNDTDDDFSAVLDSESRWTSPEADSPAVSAPSSAPRYPPAAAPLYADFLGLGDVAYHGYASPLLPGQQYAETSDNPMGMSPIDICDAPSSGSTSSSSLPETEDMRLATIQAPDTLVLGLSRRNHWQESTHEHLDADYSNADALFPSLLFYRIDDYTSEEI